MYQNGRLLSKSLKCMEFVKYCIWDLNLDIHLSNMVALVVGHEASFIGTSYGGREKKKPP